ncbi:hypothetical protein [Flavobacterium sp.]|uniref:hypothetical protein n=1 Tax=Flavobacterium sp. TaxID=239 RepID=UPI002B4B2FB5|nr:hypothetical protein [Flavobacterium sp.]HLP63273.1 hypothetical protein [Flavobacterium sp.]
MKKLLLLLLFSIAMTAQKKEAVYKKLAALTCECATNKGTEKLTETDLGLCIFESLGMLDEKDRKAIGYNPDKKSTSLERIAENVGVEMALLCPKVFSNILDEAADEYAAEDEVVEVIASSHKGSFESMTSAEFNTITITDESNTKREFIWLFSFVGDTLFIKDKIVKGDKIEVFYTEQQFFDPKTKTYKIYNEITEVKLL